MSKRIDVSSITEHIVHQARRHNGTYASVQKAHVLTLKGADVFVNECWKYIVLIGECGQKNRIEKAFAIPENDVPPALVDEKVRTLYIWIDRDRSRAVSRWVQLDRELVSLRAGSV